MTIIHKVSAEKSADMEFVLSDATLDRYGDVVEPNGWVLTNFKKNPIALFGHSSSFPIGTWSNIRVEGKKLIAKLNFAARGTSERIDELISLVEQGILRAVSVGFRPLESEPIDKDKPYSGQRYTKQELLETSLVSVPANPAAIALAKSLNLSPETISLAFGEHANTRRRDVSATGEHADVTSANPALTRVVRRSPPKGSELMKTLSQRIEDAQSALTASKDRLVELTSAETLDVDAVEELNSQIEIEERGLAALKATEKKIGVNATRAADVAAPAIARRPLGFPQREVNGLDLLVRSAVVRSCALWSEKSIDSILSERYPGNEAVEALSKAAAPLGTTGTVGFAAELQQTSYAALIDALRAKSVYPLLREKGMSLSFDAAGTAYIPSLTAGGANGSFFAEGAPMRVGRITTASTTMTARKLGVIIPFSREAAKRSTPNLEQLVRRAIIDDTAAVLDAALLDNVAETTARPAGLLNGVAAVASGYGGGDYQAVVADLKALLAPFYAANAGDNITVLMNPAQGLALSMMPGPGAAGEFGWSEPLTRRLNIVESTNVPAGRLIAIRNTDFATASGDAPDFEVSNQATIHMEAATPAEIVSATGPTTANPVRSFFQTDSMGVRMVMDVSWKMVRSGMVNWIDGTSW
ncbi:MAG: phage major capsid protein [Xanthobacteraceae bacterium]|nr:phage major capsid protein [Xanthobacteraceae bacterium]